MQLAIRPEVTRVSAQKDEIFLFTVVHYVIVTNRRRGLYWVYKREARGRPRAERL